MWDFKVFIKLTAPWIERAKAIKRTTLDRWMEEYQVLTKLGLGKNLGVMGYQTSVKHRNVSAGWFISSSTKHYWEFSSSIMVETKRMNSYSSYSVMPFESILNCMKIIKEMHFGHFFLQDWYRRKKMHCKESEPIKYVIVQLTCTFKVSEGYIYHKYREYFYCKIH